MFKKLFLPVGMVTAILLSFIYPQFGISMKKNFRFKSVYRTDFSDLRLADKVW